MKKNHQVSVLFICLGNICRSPTAHGIFESLVKKAQLQEKIFVDSCGTGDWHIGHPPDARATESAKARGFDLSELRARTVEPLDFSRFDYLMAMDEKNLSDLQGLSPVDFKGKLDLFLRYAGIDETHEVPDPYFGGEEGFEFVLDLVENASQSLLNLIRKEHQL